MCGFAGELVYGGGANLETACRMAARLVHRGPDEEGQFLSADGRFAVGFRRLCVIDPPGSHQPMSDVTGVLTVAYNGEIYNFRDLRRRLAETGIPLKTRGDTEVLLGLYAQRGEAMLADLVGMFAFALYDAGAQKLLLARDRLGEKPLWYANLGDRVVFASEAKALLEHPMVQGLTDERSLIYYLTMGYIPSIRTAWGGVSKVGPGTALAFSDGAKRSWPYWEPERMDARATGSSPAAVREAVREAVRARMVSDVPLGALLSGGLDSSIIAAVMAEAAGRAGGARTFSVGFADEEFDERPFARAVAESVGTDHTELQVEAKAGELLDELVGLYDEPFADSSALATWLICRAAREHVTVALVGDGGDEVFGGYDRYRAMWVAERMGAGGYIGAKMAAGLVRPLAGKTERHWSRRLVRFAEGLGEPPAVQYFHYRRLFGPEDLERLLTADFAETVDLEEPARWFCDLYEQGEFPDEVVRAQKHDMRTYLPDDLLVKADIASMACSLELRAPMLDHKLAELGLSLPAEAKVGWRRQKLILRQAFADMLPPEVRWRGKKGFGAPVARWLRGPLREAMRETLQGEGLRRLGIFRPGAIAGLIKDHLDGHDDHGHRLWALMVLARWLLSR